MKPKHWRLENGQVIRTGFADNLGDCVTAETKAQATLAFLSRLEARDRFGGPRLTIRNGAVQLVWHNGTDLTVESGTIDQTRGNDHWQSMTIAHADSLGIAYRDASFAYYASEEYQTERATIRASQLRSLQPEAIASAIEGERANQAEIARLASVSEQTD